jgi:hypothetical protein
MRKPWEKQILWVAEKLLPDPKHRWLWTESPQHRGEVSQQELLSCPVTWGTESRPRANASLWMCRSIHTRQTEFSNMHSCWGPEMAAHTGTGVPSDSSAWDLRRDEQMCWEKGSRSLQLRETELQLYRAGTEGESGALSREEAPGSSAHHSAKPDIPREGTDLKIRPAVGCEP